MTTAHPIRRRLLGSLSTTLLAFAAVAGALGPQAVQAQTPIKFQLDWRFEGPAALFLGASAKGHYKGAGLT